MTVSGICQGPFFVFSYLSTIRKRRKFDFYFSREFDFNGKSNNNEIKKCVRFYENKLLHKKVVI